MRARVRPWRILWEQTGLPLAVRRERRELLDLARRAGLAGERARSFVPAFRIALSAGAL